jgi:hypothetical protein
MANDDDPEGSTWRWAWRRTRERLGGIVIALIVLPIGAAVLGVFEGPAKGASVADHVWWAAWPLFTAFLFVAVATGLLSLYLAPFEQRRSLVTELGLLRARIASLEVHVSSKPVNAEHRATIKRILETALSAVEGGAQIPFEKDTDMAVIVGHFPELKHLVIEWDNQVDEAKIREHRLVDRFDATVKSLSLGPPFSRGTLWKFLDDAKRKAREQSFLPWTIDWQDDDDDIRFPGMIATRERWTVAEVDPRSMALTPEAIRSRTQQFVNQMMDWNELREYGDLAKRRDYEKCQRDLIYKIKYGVELDGYVRGNGCIRCSQT